MQSCKVPTTKTKRCTHGAARERYTTKQSRLPAASKNADDNNFTIYNYYITVRLMNLRSLSSSTCENPSIPGKTRHYSHVQNPDNVPNKMSSLSKKNVELHLICTRPLVGGDLWCVCVLWRCTVGTCFQHCNWGVAPVIFAKITFFSLQKQ